MHEARSITTIFTGDDKPKGKNLILSL